ncbi:MAG: M23 family metallopeptidase [Halobacteriovoraceae bacterium]|nr:M23 family metallopeptidase [Halobacteriovoraceae bacterium]MCB9095183.1 M23 family metallopeptidase [Halobacteriovoraceae bacterium]
MNFNLLIVLLFIETQSLLASQCPLKNFQNPIDIEKITLSSTSQESYPDNPFTPGIHVLHSGLDLVGGKGMSVYSVAPGIPSLFYPYGKNKTSPYMESFKIDHGHGIYSIYTHVDLQNISSNILEAIEKKKSIAGGIKITELNRGSGSIPSHLHFTLLDEVKNVIYNPLDCIKIKDTIAPKIETVLFVDKKNSDVYINEEDAISDFRDYQIILFAYDKINSNEKLFHLHRLDIEIFGFSQFKAENLLFTKTIFNSSEIPCGYDCSPDSFWKMFFIDSEITLFSPPSSHHSYSRPQKIQGFYYPLTSENNKLNREHFFPINRIFDPCQYELSEFSKLKITLSAYDSAKNNTKKSFALNFNPALCP